MCASYGLGGDGAPAYIRGLDLFPDELADWMETNAGATIRPTGRKARNYNPIVGPDGLELSWWSMWERDELSSVDELTAKDTINAKVENLRRSRLWRPAFDHGRVLVPMSEYYEYRSESGRNVRYTFRADDAPVFAVAGIAAPLNPAPAAEPTLFDDEPAYPASSYALVTREPTPYAAEIHNRMLLVLPPSFYADWLDPGNAGDDSLRAAALAASDTYVEQLHYTAA